ncbi:hypothetical protein GCM10010919_28460 [Alishewanella longhuensis]|uniref:Uncharacterized protein n=1 Tax=Alishewanella longhuensis TaxID=1091037 RepID=A0ABQ3L686_9ALTE|nr:hypothetical protein GCM10010919_28460 [Alishewanella longhuensis]
MTIAVLILKVIAANSTSTTGLKKEKRVTKTVTRSTLSRYNYRITADLSL